MSQVTPNLEAELSNPNRLVVGGLAPEPEENLTPNEPVPDWANKRAKMAGRVVPIEQTPPVIQEMAARPKLPSVSKLGGPKVHVPVIPIPVPDPVVLENRIINDPILPPPPPFNAAGLTPQEQATVDGVADWIATCPDDQFANLSSEVLWSLGFYGDPADKLMGTLAEFGRRLKTKILTNKNTALNARMGNFARWAVKASPAVSSETMLLGVVIGKLAAVDVCIDLASRDAAKSAKG